MKIRNAKRLLSCLLCFSMLIAYSPLTAIQASADANADAAYATYLADYDVIKNYNFSVDLNASEIIAAKAYDAAYQNLSDTYKTLAKVQYDTFITAVRGRYLTNDATDTTNGTVILTDDFTSTNSSIMWDATHTNSTPVPVSTNNMISNQFWTGGYLKATEYTVDLKKCNSGYGIYLNAIVDGNFGATIRLLNNSVDPTIPFKIAVSGLNTILRSPLMKM